MTIKNIFADLYCHLHLLDFSLNPSTKKGLIKAVYHDQEVIISNDDIKNLEFSNFESKNELWDAVKLQNDYYLTYANRYELRKELEEDSFELIKNLDDKYGFFEDEYLNDYLQQLLFSIHDITLSDGRPGNLSIIILNSSSPNAFQTPTGIIIVTTGLLSTIRSEEPCSMPLL